MLTPGRLRKHFCAATCLRNYFFGIFGAIVCAMVAENTQAKSKWCRIISAEAKICRKSELARP